MHRRLHLHPRPLMILLAIVLCLIATSALAQHRLAGGTGTANGRSVGVTNTATPSASGLTSGAAPGLTAGTPAASGLTSGTTGSTTGEITPASGMVGTPTANGATPSTPTTSQPTATSVGGSTRGVVILPTEPNAQGSLAAGAATMTDTGTVNAGSAAITGGGFAGAMTTGTPSVAPSRVVISGPLTAGQIAQLFAQADGDGDGLLTRAEALRLQVVTMSFDDMDTNRDGVVSRSEYENSLR